MNDSRTIDTATRLSVGFVLLPDFTLSTFSGFVDALRIAADEADRSRQVHCHWTILGPDRQSVRSSCGVEIAPWLSFGESEIFDYTVVVGGLLRGHDRIDRRIASYLRQVDARGGSLVGVCTGSFALARAGLMTNHRCCVHWYHLQEFMKDFPQVHAEADVVYMVDRRRITCAGGQSAIDVAVHLVERHCGRNIALKVMNGMVIAAARGPKHPQPHPETLWFRDIDNPLVQRAILLMERNATSLRSSIPEVAARLGVSNRTLARSFENAFQLSPVALFRALRLARGRWELLNSKKSISCIALDQGFSDASHFTRLFRKYYGVTPAVARQQTGSTCIESTRVPVHLKRTPLAKILFGNALSFPAIDWPARVKS